MSTQEQARSGLGLDAQRDAIQQEAGRRGWSVTWVVDEGASASSMRRAGVTQALAMLRQGQAEALVVAKLDRLSRSLLDFAETMNMARDQGWALVALDLGIDTTTPAGELVANVMAAVAQWERRVIGERTKDALAAAKAKGVHVGRRSTVPSDVRERVRNLRASGYTYRQIADALNDDQVPTGQGATCWRPNAVRCVLSPGVPLRTVG
ncbi:recombinase family protein [Calidifontibacter terrae]